MKELENRRGAISLGAVLLIILVVLVVIVALLLIKNKEQGKGEGLEQEQGGQEIMQKEERPTIEGTEYVEENNGLKTNTSSKLKETKKYGNYTLSNIRLETDLNGSVLIADVTTNASKKQEGKDVTIIFVDKAGKEVARMKAYIGQIKPGETKTFRAETTTDVTNAYNFVIE